MASEMTIFDLIDAPARASDPYPSHQAASIATPRARTQAQRALEVIARAEDGASTREIQRALYEPADPAWNKVATRCLDLQRKGLVTRAGTRPDDGGQHFLVYAITREGREVLG